VAAYVVSPGTEHDTALSPFGLSFKELNRATCVVFAASLVAAVASWLPSICLLMYPAAFAKLFSCPCASQQGGEEEEQGARARRGAGQGARAGQVR
jgi:hypothetical protein